MGMGPAGMVQGGGSALHSQSNLNDNMTSGLPSTSMMQSQMSNGETYSIRHLHTDTDTRMCI